MRFLNKPMNSLLINQTALVTGGAKGYGAGIAQRLREAGARVWITGRDDAALHATAARLDVDWLKADVTSPTDWDRVVKTILGVTGRLDVLVNNAGGGIKIAPVAEQTDESIAASIALNLLGPLYGFRRVAPVMQAQGGGIIINISSVCARHAWPGWGVYSAAKAGFDQFTKSLALELRPHGVRVTTLITSWGDTEFTTAAGLAPRDTATLAQCTKPTELGDHVVHIATLPAHLCLQETVLVPLVQEISPL
ncbi:MAG: SDR family oxidoreductase [Verrucomicrobia bacterium]|nr:SDR family oxidoreductase [Verrucomicrobiota bacterium]